MKLFLDANILISVVNNEYPLFPYCARILSLAENPRFQVYTSALCLGITWYFAEKKSGARLAKQKAAILAEKLHITEMGKTVVMNAISHPKALDFEDAMQYFAALQHKCDFIITEDRSGFPFKEIQIAGAKEFLMNHYKM